MEIGASTRLLAILGDPVAQSLSPVMHNAAIRSLGLDAVYVALRAPGAALAEVLTALAAVGAAGNVTVPHKEAVERLVARKTDLCSRAGACNTYWTERGVLVGDNTDVAGIQAALNALGADGAERWLVLGTGGGARAALVAAREARAQVYVRSRDPQRAREFAAWGESRGARVQVADGPVEADVAVNATPLGLHESDPLPAEPGDLRDLRVGLDLVYARGETRWVRALRAAGVAAQDGREMLVRQGAAAFERFFPGARAPVEVMRAAVERALRA
jgi:shikimate dehydrogenase